MKVKEFWNKFIKEYPEYENKDYTAWAFGVSASELADLVRTEEKTATTSAFKIYQIDNEEIPAVGDMSIILNDKEHPVCIIMNTKVYRTPFKNITKEHAFKEGEGDKSLAYWREAHYEFFVPYFKSYDLVFDENEIMVCEEFKCLFSVEDSKV